MSVITNAVTCIWLTCAVFEVSSYLLVERGRLSLNRSDVNTALLLQRSTDGPGSVKFDEYGAIIKTEMNRRLDAFACELLAQPTTQGYVISYAGRRSRIGEAKTWAARAKNYLLRKRKISSGRIVTIDGGYREQTTTELYIRLMNGNAPIAFPTVDPSEVQIIQPRKGRAIRTRPK